MYLKIIPTYGIGVRIGKWQHFFFWPLWTFRVHNFVRGLFSKGVKNE